MQYGNKGEVCKPKLNTKKCLGREKSKAQGENPLPQRHCKKSPLNKIVTVHTILLPRQTHKLNVLEPSKFQLAISFTKPSLLVAY